MSDPDNTETNDDTKKERISKRLSRAGVCSRREAERWIEAGRVKVNGTKLRSPVCLVSDKDKILVDGKPIPNKAERRLWRYHKPVGLVTTHADEQGRATVFENLPEGLPRVISIGRLDLNTEGLLLLTNDGELSRYLEHPSTGWKRRYRVRVHGDVDETRLKDLRNGLTFEGIRYKSIEASIEDVKPSSTGRINKGRSNTWLSVTLTEGKNREVRNVMQALGLEVSRLIRVSYGPLQLGKLEQGMVEEVKPKVLKSFVGKALSKKEKR